MKILLILLAAGLTAVPAQGAKRRTEPWPMGSTAPDFTLNDQDGVPVTLSKANGPVLLVFFRGYW